MEFVRELEEDELELCEKAVAVAKRLHELTGEKQETARGAELLILSCLLQLYASDETAGSSDTEALEVCPLTLSPSHGATSDKRSNVRRASTVPLVSLPKNLKRARKSPRSHKRPPKMPMKTNRFHRMSR